MSIKGNSVTIDVHPGQEDPSVGEQARFHNVVVGVDGTSTGRDAIALADQLRGDGGRLTLAHVVLTQGPTYRNFHATPAWKRAREVLERESDQLGVTADFTGMFAPSVGSGLHQLAEDCGADLLVVGSCGREGVGRLLVGDNARGTLSGASCPVAVAPHGFAQLAPEIATIGVAYNDTAESKAALSLARSFAAPESLEVRALTVLSPLSPAGSKAGPLDANWGGTLDALELSATRQGRDLDGVEGRFAIGFAAQELVAFSDEVDLLVVGSRGHGPLLRVILGSTSMRLAREARCPLLVVPRPAATPVGN